MADSSWPRPPSNVSAEELRESTNAITALVDERLPLQFEEGNLWGPIAHGFLARGGTLLESLTLLVERGFAGETQVMLRVLFEHVTTFCWLAIDPESHVGQWREWGDFRRLTVHKNAKRRFGITVLSPGQVLKAEKARLSLKMPELTEAVDKHWSKVSPAFRAYDQENPNILTFLGVYTAVYSKTSNLIHADSVSVERFMTMPLPAQATIHAREKRSESEDIPALALPMMAFLLIAFAQHFAWPAREVVDAATGGLMGRND